MQFGSFVLVPLRLPNHPDDLLDLVFDLIDALDVAESLVDLARLLDLVLGVLHECVLARRLLHVLEEDGDQPDGREHVADLHDELAHAPDEQFLAGTLARLVERDDAPERLDVVPRVLELLPRLGLELLLVVALPVVQLYFVLLVHAQHRLELASAVQFLQLTSLRGSTCSQFQGCSGLARTASGTSSVCFWFQL